MEFNFLKKISLGLCALSLVFTSCSKNKKADGFFIGASGPLSGAVAVYGLSVKRGAELAVKEINEDVTYRHNKACPVYASCLETDIQGHPVV